MLYPFYEDLTRDNFLKMKALAVNQWVLASWSIGCQLLYDSSAVLMSSAMSSRFPTVWTPFWRPVIIFLI
jgi:hypothetical protein